MAAASGADGRTPSCPAANRHRACRHWLLEAFSEQRLLFGSLASSAFLVYLDPLHSTNTVRTPVSSHLLAMSAGLGEFLLLGHGYLAAAGAMVATIVLMVVLDIVPPAGHRDIPNLCPPDRS